VVAQEGAKARPSSNLLDTVAKAEEMSGLVANLKTESQVQQTIINDRK
jgi:hypothetical protein